MSSTYSDLKIELIATGEQSGSWGTTTNTNLGTAIEEAITGRAEANFASDADLTLGYTNTNGTQAFRNLILNVTGTISATRNLIVPTINKLYIVENNTTGSQDIVVKTSAGTGITIPNGVTSIVYADGTNVVSGIEYIDTVTLGNALAVASGGTGASNASGARSNLGLGTIATQDADSVNIDGGAIDGTTIGGSTPAAGSFTTVSATGDVDIADKIVHTGDTNTAIRFPAADTVAFETGGSEAMRIDSSGNVGIGRSPNYKLDAYISGTGSPAIASSNDNIVTVLQSVGSSQGNIGTLTSHPLVFLAGNTERMRIDDSSGVTTFENATVEEVTSLSGTSVTIDLQDGNNFTHSLSGNTTYTFSNPASSGKASAFTLKVVQDSTDRTITWPASVDWADATAPTLSSGSGAVDYFVFITTDGGTNYYGFTAGQALA